MKGLNSDNQRYAKYSGPGRRQKGLNVLEGMLSIMPPDAPLAGDELKLLRSWIDDYRDLARLHPYDDMIPLVEQAIADGKLMRQEIDDIIWAIDQFRPGSKYYDDATTEMQRLHGMLCGVIADGVVTQRELDLLADWLEDHQHLKTIWPFDEVESLTVCIRSHGAITDEERRELTEFFSQFASRDDHRAIGKAADHGTVPIQGLCAVCPQITITGKLFCFTGASKKMSRREVTLFLETRGGRFSERVVRELDYLIVGADGNPCWAFSCYGRKVEQAMEWRRKGQHMILVHESDLWDAVGDL